MTRPGENPPARPKRFYETVQCVEDQGAFAITLDGRSAKTRTGQPLAMQSRALALAVADEWDAQREIIDIATMPMTRLAMTVVDIGDADADSWRAAILSFLKSDLLCYRASEPAELVQRQALCWDPLLKWVKAELGAELATGAGVAFVDQPPASIEAAARHLAVQTPARLLGVKNAAEIAGSAVIALALLEGAFPAATLFEASRVDEAFQAERWGLDAEAQARARRLERDFADAARFLSLV
ncbi:MAG: ATP12 family chaperone protein [Parvularculaceae bacterium]